MKSNLLAEVTAWREQQPLVLLLNKTGMTQTDLAMLLGVTRSAVGQWLGGGKILPEHIAQLERLDPGFSDRLEAWRQASPLLKKQ